MKFIYENICKRIVELLDAGTVPWNQPWATGNISLEQMNVESQKNYRGINTFILALAGYEDNRWGTYKQIQKLGGNVISGATSQFVCKFKMIPQTVAAEEETEDSDKDVRFRGMIRYFRVFNVEQTTGLELDDPIKPAKPSSFDPVAEAESIVDGFKGKPGISHDGGGRAFYKVNEDSIHMPPRAAFDNSNGYYSTLFHELGHATGHKSRLNRHDPKGTRFGSHSYGREELIAEFTSAFLCASANIDSVLAEDQASYIANWKNAIKADTRAVVVAAGQAQKAADHILGIESQY